MDCSSHAAELQRLRCRLKEKEEAVQKAAQFGLQILDDQVNMQNKLDEQRIEMTNANEVRSSSTHVNMKIAL